MEEEQQLLMLFETKISTIESQNSNNSNRKQALVQDKDRTIRVMSLNSNLYQTTELMKPAEQKKNTVHPKPPCDLNKSRYASSDLPNQSKKKIRNSQKDGCQSPKNNTKKKTIEKGTMAKPDDDTQKLQASSDSMVSNNSEFKSEITQTSDQNDQISNQSPNSRMKTGSSITSRSTKYSDDKESQTSDSFDKLMDYWNCENCGEKSYQSSRSPVIKGGGFMGTGVEYQVSEKPKIEVDICPPLEIIQPTFNDFYALDEWLADPEESSIRCPYEDLLSDEEPITSIDVDPCENESMTEWERCLAGCCGEQCSGEESQVSYDEQCEEQFVVCNDDDCDI